MKKLITLILLTAACINGFTQANLYDVKYVRMRDSFSLRDKVINNIFTDTALTATQKQLPTVTAVKGYIDNRLNNLVFTTGSYANPSWITSLAYAKLTGAPTIPTVSGTTNYIPKFTGASSLGNSSILDNGGLISIYRNSTARAFIGSPSYDTTSMALQNAAITPLAVNAALTQTSVGATVLNAASGQPIDFRINNSQFGRLTSSGNWLIGTTTDAGYKLDVNGGDIRIVGAVSGGLYITAFNGSVGTNQGIWFNAARNYGLYITGTNDIVFRQLSDHSAIFSNGNWSLGAGSTVNSGYRLDVGGTTRVQNNLVIGSLASSTARLNLPAGTATASTAPLKFTSGTNLTTPENGAVEYDGTNLYITIAGVRHKLNNNVALTKVATATYTVLATDEVISGLYGTTTTITLPAISSVPANKVYEFTVHYTGNAPTNTKAYDIVCSSGDKFNDPATGATGITSIGQYTTSGTTGVLSTKIISDGSKWILLQVPIAGLPY